MASWLTDLLQLLETTLLLFTLCCHANDITVSNGESTLPSRELETSWTMSIVIWHTLTFLFLTIEVVEASHHQLKRLTNISSSSAYGKGSSTLWVIYLRGHLYYRCHHIWLSCSLILGTIVRSWWNGWQILPWNLTLQHKCWRKMPRIIMPGSTGSGS